MILELEEDVALLQQLLARSVMVNLHAQFCAYWMEESFILLCSSQYLESALASSESGQCAVIATLSSKQHLESPCFHVHLQSSRLSLFQSTLTISLL